MGLFNGGREMTRAEFVATIIRAYGLTANGDGTVFSDVDGSAWYCGAVGKAYEYGLVTGVGGGKFNPGRPITRQEATVILQRAARLAGYAGSTGDIDSFADADSVSDWALDSVKFSIGSGLITGDDGLLRPQEGIIRAEAAAVVLTLLQTVEFVDVRS